MRFRITVDGKAYEVEVEVAEEVRPQIGTIGAPAAGVRPSTGASTAKESGRIPDDEAKVCRSPLAGVVAEVVVEVGDVVKAEQSVITLEAMKMFTVITSPVDGRVKAIDVSVGEGVKQGQLLIEFE